MKVDARHFTDLLKEKAIVLIVLILGLVFIYYTYLSIEGEKHNGTLTIAEYIAEALPIEKLDKVESSPADTNLQVFKDLQLGLSGIVNINKNVRIAYVIYRFNDKCLFFVGPDTISSKGSKLSGEKLIGSEPDIEQAFLEGMSKVTLLNKEGADSWVRVLVPVKKAGTQKVLAIFGMEVNAKSWRGSIWSRVSESAVLVSLLVILSIFSLNFRAKNRLLKQESDERLVTAKALAESEERYRLLYENATIGIYRTTPEGQVLLSNKALVKMLGYKSFEEVKERDIENGEFDPEYSRTEFKKIMERDGEIFGLENIWTRQDGKLVYIRENAKAVRDEKGKIIFYDGTIEDVTDRKLAEKALQYSEERFRQIAEQSREVVWEVDDSGLYTYISPLSSTVLGFSPEELIGRKTLFDLHTEDTRSEFTRATLEVIENKATFHDYVHEVVKGTGEVIWVITNAVPIMDEKGKLKGYRGADNDITERISREKQLKKLTLAVEQSPVSIVITDTKGCIEYCNPKACETTGYRFEELVGQNPRILKSGTQAVSSYSDLWEVIASGKVWNGEFLNKKRNGDLYWEAATISPILDDNGNIVNYLAVKEDITHIKKLITELQESKEKAESSDRLKLAFIKSITHEIRTPLHGIVGMSEHFLNTSISQQTREQLLHFIKESSARWINTVNSYLDISLLVSSNFLVNIKPFDFNLLLFGLKNNFLPLCQTKNLTLQLRIPWDHENMLINSDEEILQKIMIHLLENAVKFTEEGTITFGYSARNTEIELFVVDTGIGIDPDFLPNIFEFFTQADGSDTRAYEGSGLGLAIVDRLVNLLDGQIRVESERGRGTAFYITIPYSEVVSGEKLDTRSLD